tara:strand:- start:163 stop:555 length:393 start_codon:yes stop_codon:yes gene_type:complete
MSSNIVWTDHICLYLSFKLLLEALNLEEGTVSRRRTKDKTKEKTTEKDTKKTTQMDEQSENLEYLSSFVSPPPASNSNNGFSNEHTFLKQLCGVVIRFSELKRYPACLPWFYLCRGHLINVLHNKKKVSE